ncbi:disintegrin and metalloproteinase domain-containing protein 8a [Diretmus argenteus]
MEYETVTPRKLQDASQMTDSAQKTYPDVIQYSLTIAGQNCTLHLEKNRNLVGRNYSVTHYSEHGAQVTTTPDHEDHCYYHGHIVGVPDSSSSVGLCSGMRGFVRIQEQVYLIEPLAGAEAGEQTGGQRSEDNHAVYNYKHLRRKRSSCGHGNTTTFYDHGSRSSGLFHLSSLKSKAHTKSHTGNPRIVEMVVVVDNTEYKKFGSKKSIEARVLEVVNHVDKLYRSVGLRVMLVGLDIWSNGDQIQVSNNPEVTLTRFLEWRQRNLLPRIKHDNAQFITGVDFEGSTVGLANTNAMCTSNSGAVNEDHNRNPIGVASTIAHEMGHNLGLSHDNENCICGSSTSVKGCIMAESVGIVYPELFSSCSQQQLSNFLEEVNPACLLDTPSIDRIYGGPVCGNAYLEPGEECDCGTVQECKNRCCNASTCTFNAGAQCAEGECCHNCQLKQTGMMCRKGAGDCDLAEYCTGFSAFCPANSYTQNGLTCNRGRGYCYNGQCPSHEQHCKRLWGPDAEVAADACFNKQQNCRKMFGQRCSGQALTCGKLFCSGGWEFPVTSRKSLITLPNGVTCNEATLDPKDNYPPDLAMVPIGTKCGSNMVCYNHQCQNIKNIKVYGTNECSAKCNNHGVCNHERQCHCDPGWAPPFCDVEFAELPKGGTDLVVVAVSSAVGSLLLLVVVIGSLMCCRRKKNPTKRDRPSTSGQSNPLFQSRYGRGSPRLAQSHISQPTFVESSASQATKPLSFVTTGAILPSRAPPQPPKQLSVVPQPPKIKAQAVRPPMPSAVVSSKAAIFEAKPLPPSRPLPPLGAKPTNKPKPPMPPVKPSEVPSALKQTQLPERKAALMPPRKPR